MSEASGILSIDGEGNIGSSDGITRERVRKDVEYIHGEAGEVYSYRYRGLPREKSGFVPGLPVDLVEV